MDSCCDVSVLIIQTCGIVPRALVRQREGLSTGCNAIGVSRFWCALWGWADILAEHVVHYGVPVTEGDYLVWQLQRKKCVLIL